MATVKKDNLHKIVTAFRRGILEKRESVGMCFVVCSPLAGYLSVCGIKTELEKVNFPHANHCWLRLPDGRIIDPTADQFSCDEQTLPKVYIGPVPELYERWMKEAKP